MTTTAKKTDTRQAHLAAIHMSQKALGLSPEDASALKLAVTGVASAGDMTAPQRRKYLAHLSSLQARSATPTRTPRAPRPPQHHAAADSRDERWNKARALWAALSNAGHVTHNTDAALSAYVKRQTQVEHWRFLNTVQINTVIEALKRWCRRVGVPVHA